MDIFDNKRKFPVNPKNFDEFKKAIKDLDSVLNNFSKGLVKDADVFMKYQDVINDLMKTINNFNRTNKYKLKGTTLEGDYFNLNEKNIPALRKNLSLLKEYVAEENYILEVEKEKTREKEKQKKLDEENRRRNKLNESTQKNLSGLNNYYNYYLNNDRRNFSSALRGIGSTIFGNQLQTEAEIRDKVSQRVVKEYTRQGKTGSKYYKEMMSTINDRVDDDLANVGMSQSAKELQIAASLLNSAGELLLTGITSITKLFTQGMSRQVKIYEDTFAGIASRTGMSRSGYFNAQLNTMSDLSNRGMLDNVGVSEVQEMWNKLSQTGMSETSILINGIENVITQKVVPYLDTSSLNFNLLNARLNNQFVKDIRGINLANQELANNNYLTQDLLQKIIDEVQPMSDKAIEDLALNSTESIAMLNKLMLPTSEGGAGLSEGQAKEYLTNAFQLQKYRGQVIRNGSTYEKYLATEAQRLGINDTAGLINLGVGTSNMFGGMSPIYDTNPLEASIFSEGIYGSNSYDLAMAGQKLQGVYSSNFFSDILNMTPEQLQNYNDEAAKKLSNGEYSTATSMQEYLTENISTPVATIAEQVGTFGRDILGTLKTLVTAYLGGKIANGIASSLGISGVGGGIGALLSATGPLALSVGAVAAGVAIGSKMVAEAARGQEDAANEYESQIKSKGYDENTAKTVGKVQSITQYDRGNFFGVYKNNLSSDEKDALGITRDFWLGTWDEIGNTKGKAWDNKQWYKYNNMAWLRSGFAFNVGGDLLNDGKVLSAAIMYAIALDQMGMLGTTKETNPLLNWGADIKNKKDIENAIRYGISEGLFTGWSNIHSNSWLISDDDAGPRNLDGKLYKRDIAGTILAQYGFSENDEDDKYFMSHRQGLAKVPYDGYQAVLHAGETIMTASTTATMESMVQAFRESQNQNYKIDAAIQEQTAQLVSKIDEVINAIGSRSFGTTNTNTPSERLRESLRTLTSPLAFQG